jgi:hypothetical protein
MVKTGKPLEHGDYSIYHLHNIKNLLTKHPVDHRGLYILFNVKAGGAWNYHCYLND